VSVECCVLLLGPIPLRLSLPKLLLLGQLLLRLLLLRPSLRRSKLPRLLLLSQLLLKLLMLRPSLRRPNFSQCSLYLRHAAHPLVNLTSQYGACSISSLFVRLYVSWFKLLHIATYNFVTMLACILCAVTIPTSQKHVCCLSKVGC